MIVQFVQFETALNEKDLMDVAEARLPQYRATPGLLQKYYLRLNKPNHYAGVLIWDSRASLAAFAETELARTIGTAYKVIGAPDVDVHEMMFPLRDSVDYAPELATA